jgi:hypothetical protein
MTETALVPWEGFDLSRDSRIGDACRDIAERLADGQWYSRSIITTEVAATHGLQSKTVAGAIAGMLRLGTIEQRRNAGRRPRNANREIRLAPGGPTYGQTG